MSRRLGVRVIRERLDAGPTADESAVKAAMGRLRAVLNTAPVVILGFMPMAVAHGSGADMAAVVIDGLLTQPSSSCGAPAFAERVLADSSGSSGTMSPAAFGGGLVLADAGGAIQ